MLILPLELLGRLPSKTQVEGRLPIGGATPTFRLSSFRPRCKEQPNLARAFGPWSSARHVSRGSSFATPPGI